MDQRDEELDSSLEEVARLSPFSEKELVGQKFARGGMLGGSMPLVEAPEEAPWA